MALSFANQEASSSGTSPATTGTITFPADSVTYLSVGAAQTGGTPGPTYAVSGTAITWTQVTASELTYGSRRSIAVYRAVNTGAEVSETVSITVTCPSGTLEVVAWSIDRVTGANTADPDDAPVTGTGTDSLNLGDVGTVDAGDAVYSLGGHENGTNNFALTGYTALGSVGSLTGLRQIRTYYDDSSPDETPSWTSDGGGNEIGAIAFVVNVGAGGSTAIPVGVGSTTTTTYDLTVSVVSGPISIPVDVGTTTFTSYTPSADVGSQASIPIGVGSNTLSTYAPGLGIALSVPNAGENPETFPDDGNMGITGYDVFLDFDYNISIEVGSATLTGYDLSADSGQGTFIPVDVGSITTTGYAPEDFNSHVPSPDVGIQTITGYVPLIGTSHTRTPDTVEITITGYDVSTAPTSDIYIDISSGSITSASSSPSLIRGTGRAPDTATLGITGYTPDAISEDVSWEFFPDTGSATYSTYDLTLSIIEVHKSIPIAVGSLVIPGWKLPFGTEPSVEVGARKRRKILGFLK